MGGEACMVGVVTCRQWEGESCMVGVVTCRPWEVRHGGCGLMQAMEGEAWWAWSQPYFYCFKI